MPAGFLLVLCYIFLEIFVLAQVSALVGGWPVFGLVVLSFLAGSFILQRNRALAFTGGNVRASALIFSSLAASLFIIPGFVSDFMALLLLLPPVQTFLTRRTGQYFMQRNGFARVFRFGNFYNGAGDEEFKAAQEPEFRSEIKVTVMDSDGNPSGEERIAGRRRIDESSIIDVNLDKE